MGQHKGIRCKSDGFIVINLTAKMSTDREVELCRRLVFDLADLGLKQTGYISMRNAQKSSNICRCFSDSGYNSYLSPSKGPLVTHWFKQGECWENTPCNMTKGITHVEQSGRVQCKVEELLYPTRAGKLLVVKYSRPAHHGNGFFNALPITLTISWTGSGPGHRMRVRGCESSRPMPWGISVGCKSAIACSRTCVRTWKRSEKLGLWGHAWSRCNGKQPVLA